MKNLVILLTTLIGSTLHADVFPPLHTPPMPDQESNASFVEARIGAHIVDRGFTIGLLEHVDEGAVGLTLSSHNFREERYAAVSMLVLPELYNDDLDNYRILGGYRVGYEHHPSSIYFAHRYFVLAPRLEMWFEDLLSRDDLGVTLIADLGKYFSAIGDVPDFLETKKGYERDPSLSLGINYSIGTL